LKKLPIVPFVLCLLAVIPISLLGLLTSSILKGSIQEKVVNDPAAGLAQGLAAAFSEYDRSSKQLILDSLKFSQRDGLKKSLYLAYPNATAAALKPICEAGLSEKPFDLLAVVGKDGRILFDNLAVLKPPSTPNPTPSPRPKSHHSTKTPTPTFSSAAEWPNLENALGGERSTGILQIHGAPFLTCLFPIENRGKVLGVLVTGISLDKDWISDLQKKTLVSLALKIKQTSFSSWPDQGLPRDWANKLDKISSSSRPQTQTLGQRDFLTSAQPLLDPSGKKTAALIVFSPIQKEWVIVRDPRKTILGAVWGVLGVALALALGFAFFYLSQYRKLQEFTLKLSKGSLEEPPPSLFFPEWAPLKEALESMRQRNRERDRISLILGKVVDPVAAQKILSNNEYFSLRGEKRECTLLQVELKGFTALTENLKPEELVESLNRYFTLINEIVFKHEGMLDRFMGGSLLAVWGAPFAYDDKEKRAAMAALEIQAALKTFNMARVKKGSPPFTVGIGLHTGPVVAGNLGSDKRFDYSVLGEPLLIAARLCALTAPGQTAATQETFEKLGPNVKGEPMSPIALRDSLEPLKTFSIQALS
jgi:class 3 adenylate cyclase